MEAISVQEKKDFLQWFLHSYQLQKRECVWILNYLANHEHLLKMVHFVDQANYCPRALIMSTKCTREAGFRFYKNNVVTTDAEKAFHDIRLHDSERIYIQLNFKNNHQTPEFAAVLVDNPYAPSQSFENVQDQDLAERFLNESIYQYQVTQLKRQVNASLDERDKEAFLVHSAKLNALKPPRSSKKKK
ncbi:IDEAL domain-containing protein [Bacillaceae bacterium SIJ1]|uniref:ReoY family proteolytic degradation factor n=1 Tax=Litoribacterium kuwaitense TaxID=1398745 RepID=UPI0013EDC5D9|nr:ReoY family proteolytic degradation factor [Litoribacterium kuwaitense]NGP43720.1 IDEAL domain-containing protein [Litoribacterium kuwaitense]